MSLTTVTYLLFLTVCAAVTYIVKARLQNYVLLFFSIGFIAWAMPEECLVLMAFVLAVFLSGLVLGKTSGKARTVLFAVLTALSVGVLCLFKYTGIALKLPFTWTALAVPMGISYVVLQSIAYLAEIKKGSIKPETNPVNFFLYILFFVKLTAGPIEMPKEFLEAVGKERRFSRPNAENGAVLIAVGFIKKLAIADILAPGVANVFSASGEDGAFSVIIATVMYSVQILADFSGYTDIARGSAMILGFRLTENFNHPYSALSVRDFWRRWHISLSTWLKNYIYIPLGGSRCSTVRRFANIMATFIVSGIWHGSSLTFLVWGALHGVYQICEIALEPLGKRLRAKLNIAEGGRLHTAVARIRTFILVSVAWVFFRAESVTSALAMLSKPFTYWGSLGKAFELSGLTASSLILIAAAFIAERLMRSELVCSPSSPKYGRTHSFSHMAAVLAAAFIAVAAVYLVSAASGGGSSFIYFDF